MATPSEGTNTPPKVKNTLNDHYAAQNALAVLSKIWAFGPVKKKRIDKGPQFQMLKLKERRVAAFRRLFFSVPA